LIGVRGFMFGFGKKTLSKHVIVVHNPITGIAGDKHYRSKMTQYWDFHGSSVPRAGDLINFQKSGEGSHDYEVKYVCWGVPMRNSSDRNSDRRIAVAYIHCVDLGPNGFKGLE